MRALIEEDNTPITERIILLENHRISLDKAVHAYGQGYDIPNRLMAELWGGLRFLSRSLCDFPDGFGLVRQERWE